jgi:hypothetical protein
MTLMDTVCSSWFDRDVGMVRLLPHGGDRPRYGKNVAVEEEKNP